MTRYSSEIKEAVLKRILTSQSVNLAELSREFGIPYNTINQWKIKALQNGVSYESDADKPDTRYTAHDKFIMVVETMGMTEAEIGEYVRSKGIYAEQLEKWRYQCETAPDSEITNVAVLHKTIKDLNKQCTALTKDLEIKNKALAEYAAIEVLRKKTLAIWGEKKVE